MSSPGSIVGRVGWQSIGITGAADLSGLLLCGSALREQICGFVVLFKVRMGHIKVPLSVDSLADNHLYPEARFPVPLPFSAFASREPVERKCMSSQKTIRIVTRGKNGELRTRDYAHEDAVQKMHTQIGIDDCSTDLSLRGLPVFRGLIGPMPESKGVVRYEAPEVFESLTKEWGATPTKRKSRRRAARR